MDEAEKAIKEFEEVTGPDLVKAKIIKGSIYKSNRYKELITQQRQANLNFNQSLAKAKAAFMDVEDDLKKAQWADNELASAMGDDLDDSILKSDVKNLDLKKIYSLKGEAYSFKNSKVPEVRTYLQRLNVDKGVVRLDPEAIVRDFNSDVPLPYLSGNATDPVTGLKSKVSSRELNVLINLGVDPSNLKKAMIKKYGEKLAPYHYIKFFGDRGELILKYQKESGIPKEKFYLGSKSTDAIYKRATYEALFSKQGLDLNPDHVKHGFAGKITKDGHMNNPEVMARKAAENLDLDQFLLTLKQAKDPTVSRTAGKKTLSQLADGGDFINASTFTSDVDVRDVIVALGKQQEGLFKSTFKTVDDLATATGYTPSSKGAVEGAARKHVIDSLRETLDGLAKDGDLSSSELEETLIKAEGILDGSDLPALKSKSLDNMPPQELSAMASRVFALRARVSSQAKHLQNLADGWEKKITENGKVEDSDRAEFLLQNLIITRDLAEIRLSARAAGKTLAAHRNYDTLMARINDLKSGLKPGETNSELVALYRELINGAGGAKKVDAQIEAYNILRKKEPAAWLKQDDQFLKTLEDHAQLARAYKADLGHALNDVLINNMLSGPSTHSVNGISGIIKANVEHMSTLLGSYAPDVMWKRGFGREDYKILNDSISVAQAKLFARSTAMEELKYFYGASWDLVRLFFKHHDESTHIVGNDRYNRFKETADALNHSFRSDQDTTITLGNPREIFIDRHQVGRGSANSHQIGGAAKRIAQDTPIIGGTGARNLVTAVGDTGAAQSLAKGWDSFYQHFIRQATRKMNAADQMFKRIHFNSKIRSTLHGHATIVKGMTDPNDIEKYVEFFKKDLMLPNGAAFSEKNLKLDIYRELGAEIDPATGESRWTGKALTVKANEIFKKRQHIRDADGNILMDMSTREALAKEAVETGDARTFTNDVDHFQQKAWEQDSAAYEAMTTEQKHTMGANVPADSLSKSWAKRANDFISESAFGRFVVNFMQTPWNVFSQTWAHTPLLSKFNSQNIADFHSSDPALRAASRGRQVIGGALWAASGYLVSNSRMTGGYSADPDRRKAQIAAGFKPYTITLPNGAKLNYDRLDPFTTPLKIAANTHEIFRFSRRHVDEDSNVLSDFGNAFWTATIQSTQDSTYLKGVSETVSALEDISKQKNKLVAESAWKFARPKLEALIPNATKDFSPAMYDKLEREAEGFLDSFVKKTWPYGLPPKRHPLFGNAMETSERYPNKAIKVLSPLKYYKPEKTSVVMDELVSLFAGIEPPSPYFRGDKEINMGKYYAKTLKNSKEAKSFTARGGDSCPIGEGQDFYDFFQQYISRRKVKVDGAYLQTYKNNIPMEWTKEQRDDAREVIDAFIDHNNKRKGVKVNLETYIMTFMMSPEYQKIPVATSKELDMLSHRIDFIRDIVSDWREDAFNELIGVSPTSKDGIENIGTVGEPIPSYRGVVAKFWPDLNEKALLNRELKEFRKKGNIFNLKEQIQLQTEAEQNTPALPEPIDQ